MAFQQTFLGDRGGSNQLSEQFLRKTLGVHLDPRHSTWSALAQTIDHAPDQQRARVESEENIHICRESTKPQLADINIFLLELPLPTETRLCFLVMFQGDPSHV